MFSQPAEERRFMNVEHGWCTAGWSQKGSEDVDAIFGVYTSGFSRWKWVKSDMSPVQHWQQSINFGNSPWTG